MKTKGKISIDQLDGKRFQSKFADADPINHRKAVITHYLHNIHNGVAKHFKNDALKYVNEYVHYQEEDQDLKHFEERAIQQLLFEVNDVPFPTPEDFTFDFIDLFAGIGGFRLAMQNLGGKCVFTSEWDKEAQRTYRANFGEVPFGDITKEQTKKLNPDDSDVSGATLSRLSFRLNLFARS